MKSELQEMIDLFLKILHLYSVIGRKPKVYGTGDRLYVAEIHTITMVGKNNEINLTGLAEIMGVTRGAITQTINKLVKKNLIVKTSINKKEFNLKLSEKGEIVRREQESFHKELFTFASSLYDSARQEDRDLVKRLFVAISNNMEERVKAL
jgi:DNA-binding MarR family transcriptional regulator